MIWLLFAIIGAMTHGLANIIDNYFTNKLFKKIHVLVFYTTVINLLFLPIIILIQTPEIISLNLLPFFIILGLTDLTYLFPYYKALQSDDTSVVASLFSIGKVFVPVLAFLTIGEVLNLNQYIGFLIIIISSALLTLNNAGKLAFNKSFFYMMLCSLILSIEAVIFKYILYEVSWSTAMVWSTVFSLIVVIPFVLFGRYRKNIKNQLGRFKGKSHLFILEELLTFSGEAAIVYALVLAPVTLVKGIVSIQPLFVLLYAIIFGRYLPHMFREKIDKRNVIKKLTLFAFIIIGAILIL